MKPGYLDICYVHWMWSQVCKSRKSRCRWPRSELHLRLHTPSCYCDSHSALCLRVRKRGGRRSQTATESEHCRCDKFTVARHTFLIAVDFIRAIVFTVIEVVAAQNWADATAIRAPELVLLARWFGSTPFWKRTRVTEKLFLTCYMWKINHNKSLTSNCNWLYSKLLKPCPPYQSSNKYSFSKKHTYSSWVRHCCPHSCSHHRTVLIQVDRHGRYGTGTVLWVDTGI